MSEYGIEKHHDPQLGDVVYITGTTMHGYVGQKEPCKTYERRYSVCNGKIYCETCTLIAPRCTETKLTDIADLAAIKEYERLHYGVFL